MSEPVKIAIIMDGGAIQQVLTMGVPVEVVMIEYDNDGERAEMVDVPQGDGTTEPAFVHRHNADDCPDGRALAEWAFENSQG